MKVGDSTLASEDSSLASDSTGAASESAAAAAAASGESGDVGTVEAPLLRLWQLRHNERGMVAFLIIGKTAADQLNASALAFLNHDDFEDSVAEQLSGGGSASRAKLAIRGVYYVAFVAGTLYLLFMMFQLPRGGSSAPDRGERSKRLGGDGDGD
eukprot:CAMPEP_0118841726 /NCGR_PEP_ID=MMETSP1162-20130426/76986_1 /TAXON_ID=33656 /ORGANISM="Phaeocystis Sp, Strain CCMP2710" /LENGTH=154 /DNA_ID=CAMNT_0006773769 /DNA_START=26 /DNA_END=487 /DNA_ORIENTATION=+